MRFLMMRLNSADLPTLGRPTMAMRRFGGTFQTEQALAEMRAGVNVGRIAFERGAVTFLRLGKFAALKINVAELEMVVGVVEVMDLRLKLLDAGAACAPGSSNPRMAEANRAIDEKIIQKGRDAPADENENRPKPFAVADGVDEHPDLERGDHQPDTDWSAENQS
jgi:hypothetical protein